MHDNTEKVETYCLGRHIISVPEAFHLSPIVTGIFRAEGASVKDPAFDIVVQFDEMTQSKFDLLVQKRRVELSEAEEDSIKVLRLDKTLSNTSTLFRVQEIGESYFSELYILRGRAMVKVRLESFRNSFLEAEKKILELANEIRVQDSFVEAKLSGFCLGPVIFSSKLSKEYANYLFRDDHGLTLEIEIDTYARDAPIPLIARMSNQESLLNKFKVNHTVLRARERTVADMQADEWMGVGYLAEADQRKLKFALETRRNVPSISRPSLSITFDSAQSLTDGTPTKTEISNEEAIELWDRIVNSVRFHHN